MTPKQISRRSNALRRALLDNLASRGLLEPAYSDQVEEYISLWIIKEELNEDIRKRGAVVCDAKGEIGDNKCITKRIQISQQMSKIYKSLGFEQTATQAKPLGDDDEL